MAKVLFCLRRMGAVLLFAAAAVATAQPTPTTAGPAGPPRNTSLPLADRLDVAFRACALQLTQRDYLTVKNAAETKQLGITLTASPPPDVAMMAGRLFGTEGIYASIATPAGTMWIAASTTVPACKVTVADTDLALGARLAFYRALRQTSAWTVDAARSGPQGNIVRDALVLDAARAGPHMALFLDGPNTVPDEGRGIQLIMTVGFDTAPAPRSAAAPTATEPPATEADSKLASQFSGALANICAAVAATGSFKEQPALIPIANPPAAVAGYPATRWYALRTAPDMLLLSLDAAPGTPRCRVVLVGGSGPAAHRAALHVLTLAGAQMLQPMTFDVRRSAMTSVSALRRSGGALLFLIQSAPAGAVGDRIFQATATAIFADPEQLRAFGMTR